MKPAMWWPLNDLDGRARNFGYYGSSSTGSGNGTVVSGVRGAKAFRFAGAYGDSVNTGELDMPAPITMMAWVKPYETGGSIVSNYVASPNDSWFRASGGQWNFYSEETGVDISGGDVEVGVWQHVAVTINANRAVIYKNGRVVATGSGSGGTMGNVESNWEIGRQFDAAISDFRTYHSVLSQNQIQEIYRQGSPYTPYLEPSYPDITDSIDARFTFDTENFEGGIETDEFSGETLFNSGADIDQPGVGGGESWYFDGSDYGGIGFLGGQTTISISVWFKFDGVSATNHIISSGTTGGIFIRSEDGTNGVDGGIAFEIVGFSGTSEITAYSNRALDDGKWHHAVLTHSGSTLSAYIDGVLQETVAGTLDSYTNDFDVGQDISTDSDRWVGYIDELSVYNKELSQSEVTTLYQNFDPYSKSRASTDPNIVSSGGVARYSMDNSDVSGSTLTDTWGNNDGTINGATTGVAGIGGGESFSFDGTDDYVAGSGSPLPAGTEPYTFSVWVYPESSSAGQYTIVGIGDSGANNDRTFLQWKGDQFSAYAQTGSNAGVDALSSTGLSANRWYHVVGIRNGSQMKLYLDGVKVATDTGTLGDSTDGDPPYIGRAESNEHHFHGLIDEVRIYSRELTETEIWMLYNQGKRLIPELTEAR